MNSLKDDFQSLLKAFAWYLKRKITRLAHQFEGFKNLSVNVLMHRRGSLQSKVWHGSMVGLASIGVLTSGVFGGASLVSSSYPGVTAPDPRFVTAYEPFPNGPMLDSASGAEDTHTNISQKPRDTIVDYEVQSGDVLSGIAKKYGISTDTIKWANPDIDDINNLKPGQILKILPVTGISYTVKSGDTLESVAKKYQADAQTILDFPFNDVPDDFRLKAGQVLIVPDGVKEEAVPIKKIQPQYIAKGPSSPVFEALGGGKFVWPTTTVGISQYFAWYHPGVDLPNPARPPVAASDGGKVVVAGWPDNYGYGNRVIVDHGNGYTSIYAHLSNIYVSIGQTVSRGQVIGQMGSTGRSTGTHLHFEIHFKGVPLNPLAILK